MVDQKTEILGSSNNEVPKPSEIRNIKSTVDSQAIKRAENKILSFENPVYKAITDAIDKDPGKPIVYKFISPAETRIARYVGTVHNHDLSSEQRAQQAGHLEQEFGDYVKLIKEKGLKPLLMIEGGGVNTYKSKEDAEQRGGEFGPLVWRAQQEGLPVYSPDMTSEDNIKMLRELNIPDQTIALQELFKAIHSTVKEQEKQNVAKQFTQYNLLDIVAPIVTHMQIEGEGNKLAEVIAQAEKLGSQTSGAKKLVNEYIRENIHPLNTQFQEMTKGIAGALQISGRSNC